MENNTLPLVVITNTVPAPVLLPLQGIARVLMGPADGNLMSRAELMRLAPSVVGIVNQAELRVDAELLDAAPALRIVANVAMGVNNLDLPLMARRGVVATNVPEAFVESTADCTLAMILAVARRIPEADRYVRSGKWDSFQPGAWDGSLLQGKTLGIVGYGKVGQAVEKRARAFGLEVIHYRRTNSGAPGFRSLDDLVHQSDFVSLHTPLNADSERLFDARRIQCMKPGAYLINMARGRVVDEAALVAALKSAHLAGAGLDVFENEPRVHPELLTMNQVVLSPHLGGGTVESRHQARLLCVKNVAAILRGHPPLTPVGPGI
jgi:glyoxylate reductase